MVFAIIRLIVYTEDKLLRSSATRNFAIFSPSSETRSALKLTESHRQGNCCPRPQQRTADLGKIGLKTFHTRVFNDMADFNWASGLLSKNLDGLSKS
jgi:hypothetical protein